MSPPGMRIVIVGAGVGGLTLALLLRRRGLAADVVEQAPELREAGAAIALASNATRVLAHLGLGGDLARLSTEPAAVIHRDGRDGHPISAHPMGRWYRRTFGAPFYGLHRIDLQQLLAGAWGPGHLHLGCRVEALEERGGAVRVRCGSGATFDADLVVGADGVHSHVRSWVAGGREPVYSQTSGFRGLVPAGRLPSLPDPGALQFWMGPGAHLLHYPIAGGRLINFLAVVEGPRQWTAPAWMEAAAPGSHLEAFTGWDPAAHAMLPHQGQGANQAIEDAAVLAAELGGAPTFPRRSAATATGARPAPGRYRPPPGPPRRPCTCPTARPRSAATATWPGCPATWPGSTATTPSPAAALRTRPPARPAGLPRRARPSVPGPS